MSRLSKSRDLADQWQVNRVFDHSSPMTFAEATEMLQLSGTPTPDEAERRFRDLYSEFQLRLTNAPTPQLRALYQSRLAEIAVARDIVAQHANTEEQSMDLPIARPGF